MQVGDHYLEPLEARPYLGDEVLAWVGHQTPILRLPRRGAALLPSAEEIDLPVLMAAEGAAVGVADRRAAKPYATVETTRSVNQQVAFSASLPSSRISKPCAPSDSAVTA